MRRLAFNVFAILSLLVFVISVSIWVRSYRVGESIRWYSARTDSTQHPPLRQCLAYKMGWVRGSIGISRLRFDHTDATLFADGWQYRRSVAEAPFYPPPSPDDRVYLQFGDFRLRYLFAASGIEWTSRQELTVPLWLFLPAALPPLLWLRRRRRTLGPGFPITPKARDQRPEVRDQPF